MRLPQALESFVSACNNNARLREMNRDWSRRLQLQADDSAALFYLVSENGLISYGEGPLQEPDMVIRAAQSILEAIFSGEMTPTEPYNAGDLLVQGHQDDMMRLDILTLLIWGE